MSLWWYKCNITQLFFFHIHSFFLDKSPYLGALDLKFNKHNRFLFPIL
jgi:hypothetical protein